MISFANLKCDAYGVQTIVCQTEAQVDTLPKNGTPGSRAYVVESDSTYVLNGAHQWKKVNIKTSGGSGGGNGGNEPEEEYEEIIYDGGGVDSTIELEYDGGKI